MSEHNKFLLYTAPGGAVTLAFPTIPTHERQAYCASSAL